MWVGDHVELISLVQHFGGQKFDMVISYYSFLDIYGKAGGKACVEKI